MSGTKQRSSKVVARVMRQRFIALSPSETLLEAEQLMRMARVRALPVVLEGVLVGVLSYRTLVKQLVGGAAADSADGSALRETRVASLMEGSPCALAPGDYIEEAAARLLEREDGCLPVVDESSEQLVVILTEMDLLRAAYDPGPRSRWH
jgi:CBS domain-containing protein